jgi:PAS domain S-box-containing protein
MEPAGPSASPAEGAPELAPDTRPLPASGTGLPGTRASDSLAAGLLRSATAPPALARRTGLLLLISIVALPLLVTGVGAWQAWQSIWREANAELARTADAAAEYGMRVLVAYALAARQVDALVAGLSDAEIRAREPELHAALKALVAELPQVENSFIIDRTGAPLVASSILPVPRMRTAADRDFFLGLQAADAPQVHVSEVYVGRFDQRPFFAVSRRRSHTGNGLPPGAFDGIVNLSAFPDRLATGLQQLQVGSGYTVSLIRADGAVLVRTGPPMAPGVRVPADSPWHTQVGADVRRAAYRTEDGNGGQLVALTRLDGFPIYATAHRSRAAIMPLWWQEVIPQLAIGLPASLALLALVLLVRRGQQDLLDSNATLEARVAERTAALQEVSDALDLSPSMIVDLQGRVVHWSAGCERLYGWTREEMLGQPARIKLQTELPPGGMASIIEAMNRDGTWQGELRARRKDGRLIFTGAHWSYRLDPVTGRPNGYVSTRTDLTALRQAERTAMQSEARLRRAQEASGVIAFEIDSHGLVATDPSLPTLFGLPHGAPFDSAGMLTRIHAEDVIGVVDEHRRLARDGGTFATEFRVVWPDGSEHWLLSRGEAEPDPAGGPLPIRIRGVCLDITARRRAEAALAEGEERLRLAQEAARLGTYDYDYAAGRVTWDSRMRALWALPDDAPINHRRFVEAIHPDDRAVRRAAAHRAMDPSGDGLYQLELRVVGVADGRERWIAATGQVRFAAGRPVRLIGIAMDITDRKLAETRNQLLMREVDHRAKNALAVVQAALRLSRAESPAELVRIIEGRVAALARAQTMLAQRRWEGAELRALMEGELEPFLGPETEGAPRAVLLGPPVTIAAQAAQPLCMALHELATNAVKYGALSAAGGLLTVNWRVEAGGRTLHLTWRETGGPPVDAPPSGRGFGSRVIEQTVQSQLGGKLSRLWLADGLRCELLVPLRRQGPPEATPETEDMPPPPAWRPGLLPGGPSRPVAAQRSARGRPRVLPGRG